MIGTPCLVASGMWGRHTVVLAVIRIGDYYRGGLEGLLVHGRMSCIGLYYHLLLLSSGMIGRGRGGLYFINRVVRDGYIEAG